MNFMFIHVVNISAPLDKNYFLNVARELKCLPTLVIEYSVGNFVFSRTEVF